MVGTTDAENIENLELSTTEEGLPRISFGERRSVIMNDKKQESVETNNTSQESKNIWYISLKAKKMRMQL